MIFGFLIYSILSLYLFSEMMAFIFLSKLNRPFRSIILTLFSGSYVGTASYFMIPNAGWMIPIAAVCLAASSGLASLVTERVTRTP